jgi:NTP pyrophosphatase (non-canonical NTP hydrolase)
VARDAASQALSADDTAGGADPACVGDEGRWIVNELSDLGRQMYEDSSRWFPMIHDGGHHDVRIHLTLGLGGEAGEVLDVIKKADVCGGFMESCRMHADGKHSSEALASELADVLTYLLALAHHEGVDLQAAYEAKRAFNADRWDR